MRDYISNNDKVSKSGDTMSGNLLFGWGNKIELKNRDDFGNNYYADLYCKNDGLLGLTNFYLESEGNNVSRTLATQECGFDKNNWQINYLGKRTLSNSTTVYDYLLVYQQSLGTVAVTASHGSVYYADKTINLPFTVSDIKPVCNVMPNAYIMWGQVYSQNNNSLSVRIIGGMSSNNATVTLTIIARATTSSRVYS